uniref:Uncharacterized protein n=1 Tax=Rhizophora mucronata TaxID=61149 RepID=A0A2P2PJ75_RHIMU
MPCGEFDPCKMYAIQVSGLKGSMHTGFLKRVCLLDNLFLTSGLSFHSSSFKKTHSLGKLSNFIYFIIHPSSLCSGKLYGSVTLF